MMRFGAPLTEWRQQGQIAFWRFEPHPSNKYPGWHFSADEAGCDSLRDLLQRFTPDAAAHRTWMADPVRIERASHVVGHRRSRTVTYQRIRISCQFDEAAPYSFVEDGDVLNFAVGNSRLSEFLGAVANIQMPQHEFQVSWGRSSNETLWFWWWLNG
jgi:hypothetical protein